MKNEFDPSATFFINTWTSGYEYLIKAVAEALGTKVHIDTHGMRMLRLAGVDFDSIATSNPKTRLHACARKWRCDEVWGEGRGCIDFVPEAKALFSGPKAKIHVGCDCTKADPDHLEEGCTSSNPIKPYTVFVNCVEPFAERKYIEYRKGLEAQLSRGEKVEVLVSVYRVAFAYLRTEFLYSWYLWHVILDLKNCGVLLPYSSPKISTPTQFTTKSTTLITPLYQYCSRYDVWPKRPMRTLHSDTSRNIEQNVNPLGEVGQSPRSTKWKLLYTMKPPIQIHYFPPTFAFEEKETSN